MIMKKVLFVLLFLTGILFGSCKKDKGIPPECFDPSLVHDGACTMDCPGVEGCDGKFYCNECEAARHGIKVKK